MENQASDGSAPPAPAVPDKEQVVAAFKESGLSVRVFAHQNGLAHSTLHRWASEGAVLPESRSAELVEVPNLLGHGRGAGAYHLHFPRGLVLELPTGFRPEELRGLVQLLQEL